MKRFIQLTLALVLLAILAFPAVAGQSNPGNQIAGTWEVEVDLGFAKFINLASISKDGQIVNVNPQGGVAVGGWQRTQGRTYDITFTGFTSEPGRVTIFTTIELSADGKTFTGPALTEFRDMDGNLLFDAQSTGTGKRLPVVGF